MDIQEYIPLSNYTTFRIGGAARYFMEVTRKDDLGIALDYASTRKLPYVILAGGSNVLVADEGFDGLVVHIAFAQFECDAVTGRVRADAGTSLQTLIHDATEKGLTGAEGMYGIPGSVGGAVRGNAGAFGTEITDICVSVRALNTATREVREFMHDECHFGYRTSLFKTDSEWIVLDATFQLTPDDISACQARRDETLKERNDRQIQDIQSAGSFFMNPTAPDHIQERFAEEKGTPARERRVPAGWLIEKSGFKGACEGAACTGERSANYVINTGDATAVEVRTLTKSICDAVARDTGITLREEVTLIGYGRS